MRPAPRWVLVTAALALALVIALWPVTHRPGVVTSAADPPRVGAGESIDQLRSRAALRPCPAPRADPAPGGPAAPGPAASGSAAPGGALRGLVLPCLGSPGTVDLAAALAGRPALLNLWGPLCQPCAQELPALAAYAARPDAVLVLGVEVQGRPDGALAELAELGVRYPSVSDPEGSLRAALGAPPVIPLTYLVSAEGRVSQLNPPEILRGPEQVRAVVARYLGPGAGG